MSRVWQKSLRRSISQLCNNRNCVGKKHSWKLLKLLKREFDLKKPDDIFPMEGSRLNWSELEKILAMSGANVSRSSLNLAAIFNSSNNSHPNDTDESDYLTPPGITQIPVVQAFFYALYTTIFVLGLFGNVLVCYVVLRNRTMQTVTNFFITNLALSDILLCVLAVPFTPLYSFIGEWVFGTFMCHLVAYSQGVSVYISTLTLTSIAVDRYFVIIYPFKPRMMLRTCLAIICFIWTMALLATLPYGIFMRHIQINGKVYCEEKWPEEEIRHVFSGFTTVMQFVVPFIIMAFCYVRVSLKLGRRAKVKLGIKSSQREEMDRERKRRTNRMLIAMVAIFGCSWLPLNVINVVNDASMEASNWHLFQMFFFVSHAIAMSSTCYNPFLYAWHNENFRKEFKQVLPCFGEVRAGLGARGGGCSIGGGKSTARASTFICEKSCNGNDTVQESIMLTTTTTVTLSSPHNTTITNIQHDHSATYYDTATDTVRLNVDT